MKQCRYDGGEAEGTFPVTDTLLYGRIVMIFYHRAHDVR